MKFYKLILVILLFNYNFAVEEKNIKSIVTFLKKKLKKSREQEQKKLDIFPLDRLPKDIQNEIAAYLVFKENDADFILNTKISAQGIFYQDMHDIFGPVIVDLSRDVNTFNGSIRARSSGTFKENVSVFIDVNDGCNKKEKCIFKSKFNYKNCLFFSYSPDFSKIILLCLLSRNRFEINIFDATGKNLFRQKYKDYYHSMAPIVFDQQAVISISNDEKKIAFARWTIDVYEGIRWLISVIHNKELGLVKDFKIKKFEDDIISLSFNNDGTKIIAHSQTDYEVFTLKKEIKHTTDNVLADYFKQTGVCKIWPQE